MKNSKRMLAVIAATGLALGAMPGVANAQEGSALLDLDLGTDLIGGSIDLGLDLFVGSTGAESPLTASLEGIGGEGSSELPTDSLGEGSSELPTDSLGEGSSELPAGSLTNITGSLTELPAGSDDLGGSLEEFGTESLGEGSSDLDLGSVTEGSSDLDLGSVTEGSSDLDFGSVTEGSSDLDFGSVTEGSSELPGAGSLDSILEAIETGSSNVGSGDIIVEGSLGDSGSDSEDIMTLGSLAAVSIGIGLAVSGGVNLPALPEVNLGFVCQFPQEAIDFLKNNGSMERDECLPEDQQN